MSVVPAILVEAGYGDGYTTTTMPVKATVKAEKPHKEHKPPRHHEKPSPSNRSPGSHKPLSYAPPTNTTTTPRTHLCGRPRHFPMPLIPEPMRPTYTPIIIKPTPPTDIQAGNTDRSMAPSRRGGSVPVSLGCTRQ
ncbi:hypothetical protein E2562_024932 [Oryza meyeriana var. granulata]|uniref:Uncharacterized protein n=1 Tax=Oryza meyeriana var. granulata TaxID=110450 RepID=A0A6G1DMY0_9ORYZ|nr:hypothetical protein E2562_024932 [Oryza meyeriana var. granulata]